MVESGVVRVVISRLRRIWGVLREDLGTVRADPLPPSVQLRWLPHGMLCLAAFGTFFGGMTQLHDHASVVAGYGVPIALGQSGAVLVAMRRPLAAWWISLAATVLGAVVVHPMLYGPAAGFQWPWTVSGIISHLLVLLLVALRVPTRVAVETLALTALVTYLLQGVWGGPDYDSTGMVAVVLFATAVLLGIALRDRREARMELRQQTTLTAEERARRTLLEERSRIARELHDVVAHHMSVISIQAQVAPHLVENPSDELRENLAGIRQNALDALTELRRVLGVLRSEHPDSPVHEDGSGTVPHAPQPTLDRLEALVENTRAAGLTVTTEVTGERRPLPPGVELSAYRIVQEALSNVLRHAPGATAHVVLTHEPHGLGVEVTNTRPTGEAPPSAGAGHGLLGMRERAAMLGGGLTARPRSDGGYRVTARLPADSRTGAAAPAPQRKDDTP